MQTGKKKLVLDHLIVQKMDDGEGSKEDVQSILMFGAKALFEDQDSEERQIHCKCCYLISESRESTISHRFGDRHS